MHTVLQPRRTTRLVLSVMVSVAAWTYSVQLAVCLSRDICVRSEGLAMHTLDINQTTW